MHTLSFAGQVLTVVLIVGGVGTAFYTATQLAAVVVEGGLHRRFEQRRVTRMLEDLKDYFILFARVESDEAEHRLRRAGADRVISPYQIGATHMAQTALRPAVVDFVQLATSSGHLELSIEQVHIDGQSAFVGRTIVAAGIRQKFGVIIAAIKRADGAMEFNPSPESVIRAGDELVVLGRPESVKALEETVEV